MSYGDKTGMMGYSYFELDKPLQCFNAAKSFELGWYADKSITWDPLTQGTWFGTLVGVADYDKGHNGNVVIRIDRGGNDLFLMYNRKKNMNSGVVSNANQVTVVEEDTGYSESNFLAGITSNKFKKFDNFRSSGKSLIVEFIRTRSNLDEADIAIYLSSCPYPSCCEGEMCKPATNPPTSAPKTLRPTKSPTNRPTNKPMEVNDEPVIVKDAPITHPILVELYPNPSKQKAEYIEIYNPTNKAINLSYYQICIRNGNASKKCVGITGVNWLGIGEFFFLCRDKEFVSSQNMLTNGRICHQDGNDGFHIRNRKAVVTLEFRGEKVDKIKVGNAKKHLNQALYRLNGCNIRADNSCWSWRQPAMVTSGASLGVDNNIVIAGKLFTEEAAFESFTVLMETASKNTTTASGFNPVHHELVDEMFNSAPSP